MFDRSNANSYVSRVVPDCMPDGQWTQCFILTYSYITLLIWDLYFRDLTVKYRIIFHRFGESEKYRTIFHCFFLKSMKYNTIFICLV